jgi:translation initiation factor IF-3
VPVPRRLDRRPPEQDLTRTNERITASEVRLIDQDGQQVGVLKTPEALRFAQDRDLDLVEVAPQARPPVARVLDYSKYKYEQAQKQKQARKHQQQITVREIKFRPKIAQHDYDTKKGHVTRFLLHKYKVKVTIMFRGREVAHPERGVAILDRLAEELSEIGVVEQSPTLDGRNMAMLLAPSKAVLSGQLDGQQATVNGGAATDGAAAEDARAQAAEPADAAGAKDEAQAALAAQAEAGKPAADEHADEKSAAAEAPAAEPVAAPAADAEREQGAGGQDAAGGEAQTQAAPRPAPKRSSSKQPKPAGDGGAGSRAKAGQGAVKAPAKTTRKRAAASSGTS